MDPLPFTPRLIKARPGPTSTKGRGVFAMNRIEAGELIEACTCIELNAGSCALIERTPLDDYYFHHPGDETSGLLVLGLASLCNHSDEASADTRYERDPELGWIVTLIATREIAPGEEVTRCYACPPWFSVDA